MKKRHWLWPLVAISTVVVGGLLVWESARRSSSTPAAPAGSTVADAPAGPGAGTDDQPAAEIAQPQRPERDQVAPAHRAYALSGRVRTKAGGSPGACRVVWCPLREEWLGPEKTWQLTNWAAIEAESVRTASDDSGAFTLEGIPPTHTGLSAIWVSAIGLEASALVLEELPRSGSLDQDVVLEVGEPVRVRVVDESGRGIEGARVLQFGLVAPSLLRNQAGATLAWRHYAHSSPSGESGSARLPWLPGTQVIQAEWNGVRSAPWLGATARQDVVELRIGTTFALSGSVRVEGGQPVPEGACVRVFSSRDGGYFALGQVRVERNGAWGFPSLPHQAVEHLVELTGGGLVPRQVTLEPPRSGDSLRLDFDTRTGFSRELRVTNVAGAPLASVEISTWLNSVEVSMSLPDVHTDSKGIAEQPGLEPGTLVFHLRRAGYLPLESAPLDLKGPESEPLLFEMEPAGIIEGICRSGGQPLHTFTVHVWPSNAHPQSGLMERIQGSSDGRFRVEEAPLGDALLLVSAQGAPPGSAQSVRVEQDRVATVEVDLPSAVSGRGRIVDPSTGNAPAGAYVEFYSHHGGKFLTPTSEQIRVGADGEFRIDNLAPGDNRFLARANGYSLFVGRADVKPGPLCDLGLIPLYRQQSLEVRLTGAPGIDGGEYRLQLRGVEPVPILPFGPDGTLVVPNLSPYRWNVTVLSSAQSFRVTRTLHVGESWIIEMPVANATDLDIALRGDGFGDGAYVESVSALPQGFVMHSEVNASPDGHARLHGLPLGPTVLNGYSADGTLVASAALSLHEGLNELALEAASERVDLRIVDAKGRPVGDVQVDALIPFDPNHDQRAFQTVYSDAEGRCSLPVRTTGAVPLILYHSQHGWTTDQSLREPNGREQVITLKADHVLRVRLVDGSVPLPLVPVFPKGPLDQYPLLETVTDAAGIASAAPVSAGTYNVHVRSPSVWPLDAVVEATRGSEAVDLQVRRLGSLRVETRSLTGQPFAGVSIELRSIEFGESAADWIRDGRVPSALGEPESMDSLLSNESGELRVAGLPHGVYEWSATADDHFASGTVEVLPATETTEIWTLP